MKLGNCNSFLKYFLDLINSQVQGAQATAVLLVISGLEWEETDGIARMGTAVMAACVDTVPWHRWRCFGWLLLTFIYWY